MPAISFNHWCVAHSVIVIIWAYDNWIQSWRTIRFGIRAPRVKRDVSLHTFIKGNKFENITTDKWLNDLKRLCTIYFFLTFPSFNIPTDIPNNLAKSRACYPPGHSHYIYRGKTSNFVLPYQVSIYFYGILSVVARPELIIINLCWYHKQVTKSPHQKIFILINWVSPEQWKYKRQVCMSFTGYDSVKYYAQYLCIII